MHAGTIFFQSAFDFFFVIFFSTRDLFLRLLWMQRLKFLFRVYIESIQSRPGISLYLEYANSANHSRHLRWLMDVSNLFSTRRFEFYRLWNKKNTARAGMLTLNATAVYTYRYGVIHWKRYRELHLFVKESVTTLKEMTGVKPLAVHLSDQNCWITQHNISMRNWIKITNDTASCRRLNVPCT